MPQPDRDLAKAWLKKAEEDLKSARMLGESDDPVFATALYHCQQAAEKVFKAVLAFAGKPIEKTHNLGLLANLALELDPEFQSMLEVVDELTPYATAFRYPNEFYEEEPTRDQFEAAINIAFRVYEIAAAGLVKNDPPLQ